MFRGACERWTRAGKSRSQSWSSGCVAVAELRGYRAVFSADAAEFLPRLSRRRQLKLIRLAQRLAEQPFVRPDYSIADEGGRELDHLLVEDFVFSYWLDHAARELRIVEIEDAS